MEDNNKVLNEVLDALTEEIEALIQDNKLIFSDNGQLYRVRMPNQKEKVIAKQEKDKENWRLIKEGLLPLEKDLIKELKEKQGVDINEIQKEIDDLNNEYIQLAVSLSTKRDSEEKAIKSFKEKIAEIKLKRRILSNQKAEKLAPSIENQAWDKFYATLTCFCTERLIKGEENKWERVWKNLEDFDADDTKLPLLAGGNFIQLFYHA
jgi:vacuolar-type H+-ATPase subunit I/STV1